MRSGLPARFCAISEATFLPGIRIERGELLVDESQLLYPGDLLHEAVLTSRFLHPEHGAITGEAGDNAGYAMGAIAWSYAAALHIGLDPAIVFHAAGYRGSSQAINRRAIFGVAGTDCASPWQRSAG